MSAFPSKEEKDRETAALTATGVAVREIGTALSKTRHSGVITALWRALVEARHAEKMLEECKERWL